MTACVDDISHFEAEKSLKEGVPMDCFRVALPRLRFSRSIIAAISIGALYMAGGSPCVAAEATPVDVYGHLPSLEDLALSPDGTRVAFIETEGDERNLYVTSLNEGRVPWPAPCLHSTT
jgi:hypothetical protein